MVETLMALIYLTYCAANEIKPDMEKIDSADFDGLYEFALFHSIAAPIAITLKKAGVKNEKFEIYLKKRSES